MYFLSIMLYFFNLRQKNPSDVFSKKSVLNILQYSIEAFTYFTFKIQVFARGEWTEGGTLWKQILTIFKYKKEYHKQLELKK